MTDNLHIAIIPDGNRRWAKKRSLDPWKGHEQAIENFRSLTKWCQDDPRVSILTVWCFSTENWKRDQKEVDALMKMLEKYLQEEKQSFKDDHIRFCHSGRRDRIPSSLKELIEEVEELTKDETGSTLHLAVDYGGQDEVARAVNKIGSEVTPESIRAHLDHPELPDIDMIIRTSGEMRTSNFFNWQTSYTEWLFIDTFFPDFTTEDLAAAVNEFEHRKRNYGA